MASPAASPEASPEDADSMPNDGETMDVEDECVIEYLGDDVLGLVLRRLTTLQLLRFPPLVSKRWRQLCTDLVKEIAPPRFLAKVPPAKSSVWMHLRDDEAAQIIKRHAAALEILDLRYLGCDAKHKQGQSPGPQCLALLPHLPNLRTLVVPALEMGSKLDLSTLPSTLTELRLTFERGDYPDPEVLPGCPWCWLDNDGLQTISERCPNLEKVAFGVCHEQMQSLDVTKFLAGKVSKLRSIIVQYNESDSPNEKDRNDILSCFRDCVFMLEKCPQLESLQLEGAFYTMSPFSEVPLGVLPKPPAQFPPALRILRMTSQYRYLSPCFAVGHLEWLKPALESFGPQLQEFYCQDAHCRTIPFTPNLTTLDVSTAEWVHARGPFRPLMADTGGLQKKLKKLPKLQRLALSGATDEHLVVLGQHCPHLKEIHIHGPEFSEKGVSHARHPRVEEVTNRGVIALAEGCPLLRVVNLGHSFVTVSAIRALAYHCRQLEVLFLTGCGTGTKSKSVPGIEEDAVEVLLPRLGSRLRFLDLAGTGITEKAVKALYEWAQANPFPMQVLVLPSQPAVRDSHWTKELQKFPCLDVRFGSSGLRWNGLHRSPLLAR